MNELRLTFEQFNKLDIRQVTISLIGTEKEKYKVRFNNIQLYKVQLRHPQIVTYICMKRYNDFYALHKALKSEYPDLDLPLFPSKHEIFNKVEKRKASFFELLNRLLVIIQEEPSLSRSLSKLLFYFLTRDLSGENVTPIVKQPNYFPNDNIDQECFDEQKAMMMTEQVQPFKHIQKFFTEQVNKLQRQSETDIKVPPKNTNTQKQQQYNARDLSPQDQADDLFQLDYASMSTISNEANIKLVLNCINHIERDVIDIKGIAKLCSFGLDLETKKLRGIVWRLLLGYLPPSKKNWATMLEKNKQNYEQLCEENVKKQQPIKNNDHPLSRNKDSNWNNYFQEQQLWVQIQKDITRTRQREFQNIEYKESLTKIIFLWCKLNKTHYIQGMNEILALIFFAFSSDESKLFKGTAESDTFYCFSILMSTLKNNFQHVSQENVIFKERCRTFNELFKRVDKKLQEHIMSQKIDFQIFGWKWFIAYLAQDFQINDTLRIWDVLLCQDQQQQREEMVYYICLAILLSLRDQLIEGDFGSIITMLQQLDKQNLEISSVIEKAYLLQKEHRKQIA